MKNIEVLSRPVLQESIAAYKPTIVAARSQNPAEILSFINFFNNETTEFIYPFFTEKNDGTIQTVQTVVQELGFKGEVDIVTGLMKSAYPEGRLGDYAVHTQDPRIGQIENYLASIMFDRERGDSVFYCTKLSSKL